MPRKNEALVLAYCNQLRSEFRLGPPMAAMPPDLTKEQWERDGCTLCVSCPVASALNVAGRNGEPIGSAGAIIGGRYVKFPAFVTEFMDDHDLRVRETQF